MSDDTIEIIIRDSNMRKLGTWKFDVSDKKLAAGIFRHIRNKYSLYEDKPKVENLWGLDLRWKK